MAFGFTPRANPNEEFERLRKAAAQARLPFDKDAYLNIAFYLDEQYVEWAAEAMTVRRIPRAQGSENTPRPVQNKIMHYVLQKHAQTLSARPTADVFPANDDPVSASNANVSLAYLRWLLDPQQADLDGELSDAALWALVAGEGFLKWTWNAREKRGDICSASPLDIYSDPYVKKFKDSRYVIHSQFMDVEQVYDIYGIEVSPNQVEKADHLKAALLRDMGQAPVLRGCTVNEIWMKPCRRYPEGLFATWTDRTQLVTPQKFPYKHGHLPFTQIGSIPRPGSPRYMCAVKFLRNPQMELNKYHAQRITVRESFANPKWWIPAEIELEVDPDDSPRQILRGNGGAAGLEPKIIQGATFPVGDEGSFILEEMMHTAGQHEVSQAQVPGRVEAAKAIEMLKESDEGHQAEMLRTIKNAITEGSWQMLELARQFVDEDVLVTVYSRDGMPEVKKFKADHAEPGQRIQITMGTGLARSRAAREDQVYKMLEAGIIQDPETAAELLDLPVGQITPNKASDIRLARNENYTMEEGHAIVPNSWDDHAIHIREHNQFRKSSAFLLLDVETKKKFEMHVTTHEELQLQELQKMAERQMVMAQAGAPPAAGGPPQTPPSGSAESPA